MQHIHCVTFFLFLFSTFSERCIALIPCNNKRLFITSSTSPTFLNIKSVRLPMTSSDEAWTESMQQKSSSPDKKQRKQIVHDKNNDPCWQDIYDDDCYMSNVYSASFVAMDWIKDLPCAKGKDCVPPISLTTPVAHGDGGIGSADVMGMLGLKRAKPLK